MLIFVGLGLGDLSNITLAGMQCMQSAGKVFLEHYTSILACDLDEFQKFINRFDVIVADRELVESNSETILASAKACDVAFCVVGDALAATTHSDLMLRAKKEGIAVKVIHNASIVNGVACSGLQLYRFGEIISIPLWTDNWQPNSFVDKLQANMQRGLHTLCLLDIKVKEPNLDMLVKSGRVVYDPPVFMTCAQAAQQLCKVVKQQKKAQSPTLIESGSTSEESISSSSSLNYNSVCVALARVGHSDEQICVATLYQMQFVDMGKPLHCIVVPGELHALEREFLEYYVVDSDELLKKAAESLLSATTGSDDDGYNVELLRLNVKQSFVK